MPRLLQGGARIAPPLAELFSDAALRRYAGVRAFQRGCEYYRHGHVESVRKTPSGFRATVRGQYEYTVTCTMDQGELDVACTCPMGRDSDFCKHCVAASMAFLHGIVQAGPGEQRTLANAVNAFAREPREKIAKLLLAWAEDDERLSQRLMQYAARQPGPEKVIAAARAAFKKAAVPRQYYGYGEAGIYAEKVDRVIDGFEEILTAGHAGPIVDLCEFALQTLADGAEMVEEDDGEIAGLQERLLDMHLRACQESCKDPVALAQRLFHLEMEDESEAFYRTAITYKDVLGPAGLIAFRTLAEAPEYANDATAKEMLESVARASGDVDWLVSILARDLTSAYDFLQIAEACQNAGRGDDALRWAERGLAAYPSDFALTRLAANEYHRRGEHSKSMQLIWPVYTNSPGMHYYKLLEQHATQAGEWPEWRDSAIGLIRKGITGAKGKKDHSELVEIFLYEKNSDAAWQEAQKGGCYPHLWLDLAQAREEAHPEDAAPIYLRQAEVDIINARKSDYEPAVVLLSRAAKVMIRIGATAQFARHLDMLRARYKTRRNFIKLLDSTLYAGKP